jgi:hypothetical protein
MWASDPKPRAATGQAAKGDERRSHDLLVLGSDEHRGDTDELELDEGDDSEGEESVDDVDGDPERLGSHLVSDVDLLKPVDEGRSHRPVWNEDDGQC